MDPLRPLLTQQEALIPIQAPCFKKQPGDNFVIVLDGMPNGRMALLVRQIEVQIISQQQQPIPQTSAPQHGPHAPTQTALPPPPARHCAAPRHVRHAHPGSKSSLINPTIEIVEFSASDSDSSSQGIYTEEASPTKTKEAQAKTTNQFKPAQR